MKTILVICALLSIAYGGLEFLTAPTVTQQTASAIFLLIGAVLFSAYAILDSNEENGDKLKAIRGMLADAIEAKNNEPDPSSVEAAPADKFLLNLGGDEQKFFTREQITELRKRGLVTDETPAWHTGSSQWLPLGDVGRD